MTSETDLFAAIFILCVCVCMYTVIILSCAAPRQILIYLMRWFVYIRRMLEKLANAPINILARLRILTFSIIFNRFSHPPMVEVNNNNAICLNLNYFFYKYTNNL